MEGPDEGEEQRHVHDDREVQQPGREALPPREIQAAQGEQGISAESDRNQVDDVRVAAGPRLRGLNGGQKYEEQHHTELKHADEPLALGPLPPDLDVHALRKVLNGRVRDPEPPLSFPGHRVVSCVAPAFTRVGPGA